MHRHDAVSTVAAIMPAALEGVVGVDRVGMAVGEAPPGGVPDGVALDGEGPVGVGAGLVGVGADRCWSAQALVSASRQRIGDLVGDPDGDRVGMIPVCASDRCGRDGIGALCRSTCAGKIQVSFEISIWKGCLQAGLPV